MGVSSNRHWVIGVASRTPHSQGLHCLLQAHPTLMGYSWPPYTVPTAKPLAPWWGHWRETIREVGSIDRAGPLMGVWAAGRGHVTRYQIPGAPEALGWAPPSPIGPKVSYGHIRQPETETNHSLPSWHLARACADLLPGGNHIYEAPSVCLARWQPSTSVLPKGDTVIPIVQMRQLRLREVM